jgi:hypothetical protein
MNKYSLLVTLALTLGVLGLIALVVDTLKLNTLALMAFIVLIMLPLIAVAVGLFWLQARRPAHRNQADEQPPIDAPWRELTPAAWAQLEPPASLPRVNRVNVPIQFEHGSNSRTPQTILTSVATDEHNNRVELECPLQLLQVAARLLQDGQQPTRSNFNAAGVMSSSEITACTQFLRAHGWLKPAGVGSTNTPARWVEGATCEQLNEFVSTWSA